MSNIDHNLILNCIVNITENRDLEILEMSLLRTIFEVVLCRKVFLLKSNMESSGIICSSCFDKSGFINTLHEPDLNRTLVEECIKSADETGRIQTVSDKNTMYIICPVVVLKKNIAFIAVEDSIYRERDVNILESLIKIYQNYVSVILDNQRDTLTGLLNRKTFDDKIMKLIELKRNETKVHETENERRRHSERRFWLGIFDIDFFKRINDTYGHVFGDEVLILISRLIQDLFRADDLKFRYGGEEFITVIKAESTESAYEIFERFRKKVESYSFPQIGKVTVSTGIVEITGNEMPTAFVGSADKALYYAKENGRNRTCVYSDLIRDGHIASNVHESRVIFFED